MPDTASKIGAAARTPSGAITGARELRSVEFRREREATWRELEDLIAAADRRGLRTLGAEQLARLPHLYRAALSSLSVARSISLDLALIEYLENLVGRAYFVVYGTRQHLRRQLAEFFGWKLPATVRAARWHILAALVVTLAAAIAAFQLTSYDLDYYYAFASDMAQGRTPASSTAELRDGLYHTESASGALTTFAAGLFSNNARIGILSFATGFVAGLPTLLLLFYNGLVLGAFAALYHARGLSLDLWAWMLPHGVTELTALILCGAAGFQLAQALVFPGARTRTDSLREHGRSAAVIVIGAVLMFFIAGLIEGVFRQTVTSVPIRYAVAGTTAAWWTYYFGFVGRRRARRDADDRAADDRTAADEAQPRARPPMTAATSGGMEVAR
jgi:uncharacterized membrane protein SpoIIM required for sporulation